MNNIIASIVLAVGAALALLATIVQGISAALDVFKHPATAGRKKRWMFALITCIFAIIFGWSSYLESPLFSANTSASSPMPTVNATSSVAQPTSPTASANAAATPTPSPTAVPPTPTPSPSPTAATSTLPPSTGVVAAVQGQSYPIYELYATSNARGGNPTAYTAQGFLQGTYPEMGAFGDMGIDPHAHAFSPHSGWAWIVDLKGGTYGIAISVYHSRPLPQTLNGIWGTTVTEADFVGGVGGYTISTMINGDGTYEFLLTSAT